MDKATPTSFAVCLFGEGRIEVIETGSDFRIWKWKAGLPNSPRRKTGRQERDILSTFRMALVLAKQKVVREKTKRHFYYLFVRIPYQRDELCFLLWLTVC